MKATEQKVKSSVVDSGAPGADRAEVSARFHEPREPRLTEVARVDCRAENILFPVLCACGLFAIATHFYSALPTAQEMEVAFQECLRYAGLC